MLSSDSPDTCWVVAVLSTEILAVCGGIGDGGLLFLREVFVVDSVVSLPAKVSKSFVSSVAFPSV